MKDSLRPQTSAKNHILAFLQGNPGSVYHGGQLQRMEFKNRNGSNATGDTIKRRLNDLVVEKKIHVDYKGGQAYFSAEPIPAPKRQVVKELPNGKVEISYV